VAESSQTSIRARANIVQTPQINTMQIDTMNVEMQVVESIVSGRLKSMKQPFAGSRFTPRSDQKPAMRSDEMTPQSRETAAHH
jgi:hypothetical protein